jgi:small subunit ribosomal protein S20
VKKLRVALTSSKGDEAKAMHSETIALIDKAVQKRILHRNAAARYKSRLTRHVNKATAK